MKRKSTGIVSLTAIPTQIRSRLMPSVANDTLHLKKATSHMRRGFFVKSGKRSGFQPITNTGNNILYAHVDLAAARGHETSL